MGKRAGTAGWLLAAAIGFLAAGSASAQTIGTAETVRNSVVQVRGSGSSPIGVGDSLVRNEVVRAGAESAAKLVFRDNTNLAVGPNSTVTLDRFVFRDDDSASKVSVNLVKGAFRFTTGDSAKRAYEIKTPVATIGVRGTDFDVSVRNGTTVVYVREGSVSVCAKSGGACATVNPGQSVTVTASGVGPVQRGTGPTRFSFSRNCGSDGLCQNRQYASTPSDAVPGRPVVASNDPTFTPLAPTGSGGALCGR